MSNYTEKTISVFIFLVFRLLKILYLFLDITLLTLLHYIFSLIIALFLKKIFALFLKYNKLRMLINLKFYSLFLG